MKLAGLGVEVQPVEGAEASRPAIGDGEASERESASNNHSQWLFGPHKQVEVQFAVIGEQPLAAEERFLLPETVEVELA